MHRVSLLFEQFFGRARTNLGRAGGRDWTRIDAWDRRPRTNKELAKRTDYHAGTKCGTHKTAKARFRPWLSGKSAETLSSCSLVTRLMRGRFMTCVEVGENTEELGAHFWCGASHLDPQTVNPP